MTLVWTRALGKTAVIPYGPSKCSQHWSGHRVLCIPHDSERPCCSGYVWPTEDCVCHLHILPRRKRFVPKTLPSAIKPAWHSDRRNAITTNACIAPPWWRHLLLFLLYFSGLASTFMWKVKNIFWPAGQWGEDRVYIYVSIFVLTKIYRAKITLCWLE